MANIAVERVKKEFKELSRNNDVNDTIKIELVDQLWTELIGQMPGPVDTPYEGGTFMLEIKIPDSYPFNPPKVRFITKVWHPNVSSVTGAICLDILKDEWAAALTIRTVLISLQGLLSSPEPNDPQDAVVAKQYINNLPVFKQTARHWTNAYASGPIGICEFDEKIKRFAEMGFDENTARVALSTFDWDEGTYTEHRIRQLNTKSGNLHGTFGYTYNDRNTATLRVSEAIEGARASLPERAEERWRHYE